LRGRSPKPDDILLGIALVATALVARRFVDYAYDDAYITYRYAQNIAAGHGFAYNLGDSHLGTTTPLYTLILAALYPLLEVPVASGVLSIAALLLSVVLFEMLGRSAGIRFAGPASAVFLALNTELYRIFGGETLFTSLLLLPLGLWLHRTGHRVLAGAVFGAAVLTRMDALLFPAIVYADELIRQRRIPWRALAALLLVTAPWFVYAQYTFGSPLPATLEIKRAHAAGGWYDWPLLLEGSRPYLARLTEYQPGLRWIFLPVLLLGAVRVVRSERIWLPFAIYSLLFGIAYQLVLRVPFSHWYLANVHVTNALLLGAGLRQLWALAYPHPVAVRATAAGVLGVALLALAVSGVQRVGGLEIHDGRRRLYTRAGQWLRLNSEATASVHFAEIGYLGYHAERTIIDPIGLVTPGGREAILRGDRLWAFEAHAPEYFIVNTRFDTVPRRRAFAERYALAVEIEEPGHPHRLFVFRRRSAR
jgi:hypothetical protein